MKIKIANLGPVDEGTVDVSSPLTILVGPNNSGKTYIAWAIYGLFRFRAYDINAVVSKKLLRPLVTGSQQLDVRKLFHEHGQALVNNIAREYRNHIPRIFSAPAENFRSTKIDVLLTGNELSDSTFSDYSERLRPITAKGKHAVFLKYSKSSPVLEAIAFRRRTTAAKAEETQPGLIAPPNPSDTPIAYSKLPKGISEYATERLSRIVEHTVHHAIFGEFGNTYSFPTERAAISVFSRELSSRRVELVDEVLGSSKQYQRGVYSYLARHAAVYPLPIRDALAMSMWGLNPAPADFSDIADDFENLLGGSIVVSNEGQPHFWPRRRGSQPLAMHHSSSIVRSLASIVLYLRNLAAEGDTIIIDEPELNLHPDSQRIIARLLAKMANRGFKIIASTHSDYFLQEINNLIMLGGLPQNRSNELMAAAGIDSDESLKRESVKIHLVSNGSALPLTIDHTGFSVKPIQDEIAKLNKLTQQLYGALED